MHHRLSQSATINMASFFGLGGPAAKVEIALDNSDGRKSIEVASEEAQQELMIYSGGDKVSGTVKVIIPSGKKLEHLGIKVEVIGTIGELPFLPQWIPFGIFFLKFWSAWWLLEPAILLK